MSIYILSLGLFLLLSQTPSQSPSQRTTIEPPKPTLNISLGRQTVRENDCVPVEVWFSSEGAQEIAGVSMQIASPEFIRWSSSPCEVNDSSSEHNFRLQPLQTVQPNSTNSISSIKLYLRTGSNIDVGDHNLLFTFQYSWKADQGLKQSFIAGEKTIKANFLGSESVAGVPLGLVGLIVPGLFFWIILRVLKIPWGMETPLGDKLIYSVVVSFIFVAMASALVKFIPALHYLDISNGISINKLIWLAGTGIGAGLLVSLLDYAWRSRRQKRVAATEISVSDSDTIFLGKLLNKNSIYRPSKLNLIFRRVFGRQFDSYKPQTRVELKNREIYIGSLGEKGEDLTTLVGWFKVNRDDAKAETSDLEKLQNEGRLVELFAFAKEKGFEIVGRNRVKQLTGGRLTSTERYTMVWPSADVLRVVTEPYKSDGEALVLESS